ncbi:MAG TPA: hypothetical protein VK472_04370 [Allosphingosinicella sp.]|nr:hypothetical protein [Allosphingosinicella sp.]
MQGSSPGHLLQFLADLRHSVADQPAVGLDLGLAGAAEEAEAAALALEVGPAPDQPPRLIVEMGELDLEPPFRGSGALSEYLEDQAGSVDHLGLRLLLEILLLDRSDRGVDDDQLGLGLDGGHGDRLDLARSEQGGRLRGADSKMKPVGHVDSDRLGEARGLVQPRLDVPPRIPLPHVGQGDDCAGASGNFVF